MGVNVCAPVLRRYDLLREMLRSLEDSTIRPDKVYIVNNGVEQIEESDGVVVHVPERPLGVAAAWNWFLQNVPEERIICNDDVTFSPDSLQIILDTDADFVFLHNCGFSCFRITDKVVRLVGEFDEDISPGYAYYEDVDYAYRMVQVPEVRRLRIEAGVQHAMSSTWRSGSDEEIAEHWRKFSLAKANFEAKWGFSVNSLAGVL